MISFLNFFPLAGVLVLLFIKQEDKCRKDTKEGRTAAFTNLKGAPNPVMISNQAIVCSQFDCMLGYLKRNYLLLIENIEE